MFRWSIIFASDWFGPLFLFCQNQFYDRSYLSNVWMHRYLAYLANWRQDTDVSKHLTDNPDHKIDFDKTEIMAQTNHWRKLLITETLLIQNDNPNLNVDRTSIPLYLFHTWVIWIILSPAAAFFWCFICLCFVFFAIHYFWQCEK